MTSNKSREKDNRPCFNMAPILHGAVCVRWGFTSARCRTDSSWHSSSFVLQMGFPAHSAKIFFSKPENWRLFGKSLRDADRERIGNCIWKKKRTVENEILFFFFFFTVMGCPKTLWKTDRLLGERDMELLFQEYKEA